jgi:hypothetical protein
MLVAKLMIDGHYLNLPVVHPDGKLMGIVDVLKLTYATLEQVRLRIISLTPDRQYERGKVRLVRPHVGQIL